MKENEAKDARADGERAELLLEVARGFTGKRSSLYRVFATEGEVAASDGKILFHAWERGLFGGDPVNEGPLGYCPPPMTRVAEREWIAGTFAGAAQSALADAKARLEDMRRKFEENPRLIADGRITDCPCCGAELVVHDDYDIESFDEWMEDHYPSEATMPAAMTLRIPGRGEAMLSVWNLGKAFAAAKRLGGAESLELTEDFRVAAFRGEGWVIIIAAMRPGLCDEGVVNTFIDVPEFGRDLTAPAVGDGGCKTKERNNMNLIARAMEWMWPGLREWRIEAEMEDGGEDAISARDAAWMEERNRKRRNGR